MDMSKYLPILILFIFADVVGDNSILRVFGTQPPFSALILSMGMLLLQTIAAPIQAGFSDFYCRKKSLIVSLSFSFLSLFLLIFTKSQGLLSIIFLVLIALIKGAFGNTVPLAWAALADTQEKNLRFSLALSTGAYAIGYMVLAILNASPANGFSRSWLSPTSAPTILFILSILICLIFFRDIRDRKARYSGESTKVEYLKLAHSESTSLLKDIRRPSTRWGLLSYFLWATSQYSVLILITDFQTIYTTTVILMMCGYLTGVTILGFCKKTRDQKMIKIAFIITISALCLYFIVHPFMHCSHIALSICYFFYTLANAFLSPSILSLFSKERELHEQGKGFGLIVSADSGGFLVASLVVIVYYSLKLDPFYMILFSFITFLISWIPYSRYENARKDAARVVIQNK